MVFNGVSGGLVNSRFSGFNRVRSFPRILQAFDFGSFLALYGAAAQVESQQRSGPTRKPKICRTGEVAASVRPKKVRSPSPTADGQNPALSVSAATHGMQPYLPWYLKSSNI